MEYRCFHCEEVFTTRETAYDHFGQDEGCEKLPPACIDPLRHDEKERIKELRSAQKYAFQCQEEANALQDKLDDLNREFDEFKKLSGCNSVHELRMWIDYQQGRVNTADTLIKKLYDKFPELVEKIIG